MRRTPTNQCRPALFAYHEMGHALLAATLPGVDPVHKVSIIPRRVDALGYALQRLPDDRFFLGAS